MVTLQKASQKDIDIIYEWQIDPITRKYFHNNEIPSYSEHCKWVEDVLCNKNILLYIIMDDKRKVGCIRLNISDVNTATVSILLSSLEYGKGFAFIALRSILEIHKHFSFEAFIHAENKASKNLFLKCGFQKTGDTKYIKEAESE